MIIALCFTSVGVCWKLWLRKGGLPTPVFNTIVGRVNNYSLEVYILYCFVCFPELVFVLEERLRRRPLLLACYFLVCSVCESEGLPVA